MNAALYLIPISLFLALCALMAFLWTVWNRQYDDMEGDSARILDMEDRPLARCDHQDAGLHACDPVGLGSIPKQSEARPSMTGSNRLQANNERILRLHAQVASLS